MADNRSDSLPQQAALVQSANEVKYLPHVQVSAAARPFYEAIVKARTDWTDVDLAHAANLARCQADIEDCERLLKAEGTVIENNRGTPVMNPRHTALEQLSRRSVALSRMIQVHAIATVGPSEDRRAKNKVKRDALSVFDEDDDLIARPN